ncbi:hypothetical protein HOO65_090207 [Ceratocystis lukuohia]|uniref:HTH CENPB-type domain-containing protein n=1 Tax=Ceratocystis lukuohia TaxID=2019550 RepID=A0ABR4M9F9_9PEZI
MMANLLEAILLRTHANYPISNLEGSPHQLRGVEEISNWLFTDRDASPFSKLWAYNFVRRQKGLKTRFDCKYNYYRDKCGDSSPIHYWFRLMDNTFVKQSQSSQEAENGLQSSRRSEINVEGWAIALFIVAAVQHHLANWYQENNIPDDWATAMAHNGQNDNDTGLDLLQNFDQHAIAQSAGRHHLLILDRRGVTTRSTLRNIAKKTA